MVKLDTSVISSVWCRYCRLFLALSWITGLLIGMVFSVSAGDSYNSLMRMALFQPASIVSLLMTVFLPFLTSAIAVIISKPSLLIVVCFLKAACFSFVSVLVLHTFGSSGWLIRFFVMFADICLLPVLYSFWLRHIPGEVRVCAYDAVFVAAAVLICSLDICYISPFLAKLV